LSIVMMQIFVPDLPEQSRKRPKQSFSWRFGYENKRSFGFNLAPHDHQRLFPVQPVRGCLFLWNGAVTRGGSIIKERYLVCWPESRWNSHHICSLQNFRFEKANDLPKATKKCWSRIDQLGQALAVRRYECKGTEFRGLSRRLQFFFTALMLKDVANTLEWYDHLIIGLLGHFLWNNSVHTYNTEAFLGT
jgi:hypothetical protein